MGVKIENQRVAKRRKINQPNYKSAGFNPGFIRRLNIRELFKRKNKTRKSPGVNRVRDGMPGFTFNVPILSILAAAAGCFVISLAVFNWEDIIIDIKIPDDIVIAAPLEDEAALHAINYASSGETNLLTTVSFTGNTLNNTDELSENPQNDLITFEWQHYKVKKNDNVTVIANRFGVSIGAVIASNNITNARNLREGQILRIPNIDGIPYTVNRGDSLQKIAANFNIPLEVILDINDIKSDNIKPGDTLFIPGARMNDIDLALSLGEAFMHPISSRNITSRFGMRKDPFSGVMAFHTGVDFSANTGTPVVAALDGVISVVSENWLYGRHIIITHDNGYKSLYAHLNSFSVRQGERVARGRKIAESGDTGLSTGPHLHFSIYDKNNKLVNPLELIK